MISFDSTCINSIEKNITAQFMELAQKTLVWDVRSKLENISKNTLITILLIDLEPIL